MIGDRPIYFMFKPEAGLAQEIARFRHEQEVCDRYPIDRLHSTVQPLCDRREMTVHRLQRILTFMSRFRGEPVMIVFNRFNGTALRATATVAFRQFRTNLQRHLREAGISFPDNPSDPHLTLTYRRPSGVSRAIEPFVLCATHLLLIESIHGKGHVELGRWSLLPRQGELFH